MFQTEKLKEELTREAQRLSRTAEQNRLDMEKALRDLIREQEACRAESRGAAKLKRELEESLAKAREGREGLERERSEMLRGFQDVRMDLEASVQNQHVHVLGFINAAASE